MEIFLDGHQPLLVALRGVKCILYRLWCFLLVVLWVIRFGTSHSC